MLSINTNLSSLIAQNSMRSSTNKLNQAIERMTTGSKINHASDNAANYSISTNMTTKMNSYMVAEDNVLKGFDMTNAASESLSLIEDNLKRLRSLATQASNGTYGNQSLNAVNSEAVVLVDEINRIYSTAEYNGLKVFKPVAKIEIPDGVGTTGDVGVQTPTTYSMRDTYSLRATDYGEFIDNPYTYTDEEIADMKTITQAISESSLVSGGEYSISSKDELVALADYVNAGNDTTGMTFVLGADIDLSSISNWTPIGNFYKKFKGVFDGNGHIISNLTINRSANDQGLFGRATAGASLQNVGLEHCKVTGAKNTGGVVGVLSGYVANCYISADIQGTQNVGGIIGVDAGDSVSNISNCYAEGSVTATSSQAGGIIGFETKSNITNCYAKNSIKGTSYVGGIAGRVQYYTIENCKATGAVTGTGDYVGGLVGGTSSSSVINCSASGKVVSTGSYVGGLVGQLSGVSIKNSYATGDVLGADYVGGLVGKSNGSVINSYATGNVSGSTNVGGLAGYCLVGGSSFSFDNNSATGDVSGSTNVGGLLGSVNSSRPLLDSYSTGSVNGASFVGGLVGKVDKTSGTQNITNCISYSKVKGIDANSTGGLIGGAILTTDNSTFGTINITSCQSMSQDMNSIGGSYMYANSTYTLLPDYDMSTMNAGVSLYTPEITSVTLQVGTDAQASSQITFDMAFMLENIDSLYQIGQDTTTDFVSIIDDLLATVSAKQTEYGAVQNRLESALDEIATQYENLASSRSTIRDADMAKESATYIQQQILQEAAATLMSTANQSPAIALQLI